MEIQYLELYILLGVELSILILLIVLILLE